MSDLMDLSRYRLEKAYEMLATAQRDLQAEDYASAHNRAYYCIFHAMRAILALDGEDYQKHSAVIARFSMNYLIDGYFAPRVRKVDCQCVVDS